MPIRYTKHLLAALLALVIQIAPAQADVILGAFDFNSLQFGNTLTESDGGVFSSVNWLNTNNANPGNPGFLTGANFNTGIANIGFDSVDPIYTIGYNTPINNHAGADLGVVVARFTADDFTLAFSSDGTTFTSDIVISSATASATGVSNNYFYGGFGPFNANLFVHSIDLSDFGFAPGANIVAARITSSTELDLIRIAGFATAASGAIPEPGPLALLAIAAGAFAFTRRRNRA